MLHFCFEAKTRWFRPAVRIHLKLKTFCYSTINTRWYDKKKTHKNSEELRRVRSAKRNKGVVAEQNFGPSLKLVDLFFLILSWSLLILYIRSSISLSLRLCKRVFPVNEGCSFYQHFPWFSNAIVNHAHRDIWKSRNYSDLLGCSHRAFRSYGSIWDHFQFICLDQSNH